MTRAEAPDDRLRHGPSRAPGLTVFLGLLALLAGLVLTWRAVQTKPDAASNPSSPQALPGLDPTRPAPP